MKRSNQFSTTLVGLFTLGGLILLTVVFPFISPAGELQRAWQHANDVGVYAYQTEIIQTAHPLPILANVGLSSTENRISIQGKVNRPAKQMQLSMWDGSKVAVAAASETSQKVANSSTAQVMPANSIQIRLDQDKSYGRLGMADWQELKDQDVTGVFAPGKDVLGYLAAAKNVKPGATEVQGGVISTRYAFDVDGPAFAQYMNKQLEAELQRKGKLPAGLSLDMTKQYAQWKGTGEIWVDAQGLPLRQLLSVAFPHPYNQETVEATIRTDFSNWRGNTGWAGLTLPQMSRDDTQQASLTLAFLAFLLAGMGLMLRNWRSRRVYLILALYIILTMPLTPLLQGLQTHAFASEQQDKQQEQQQQQKDNKALKQVEAEMLHTRDPHADPLATQRALRSSTSYLPDYTLARASKAPATTNAVALAEASSAPVDTDKDGLTDEEEVKWGTNKNSSDSDGDYLNDGLEAYELGTNPTTTDTDGDNLSDYEEVKGFFYNSKMWYLDPFEADSNKDGLTDKAECPAGGACPDTDGDLTPDVWDSDNDNDGVPDNIDSAPSAAMGGGSSAGKVTGFANQTLEFQLSNVTANKSLFADFQLRPVNQEHLWYTLNVYDWPNNDRSGQVQRINDTTFRDLNQDKPSSEKDSNGDMRLIPMLEVEIPFKAGTGGGLPIQSGKTVATCPVNQGDAAFDAWLDSWLDNAELGKYNISVKVKDKNCTLLAFVPLTQVRDKIGGSPVAFSGRMFYRSNSSDFGATQKIRLLWMVQMITDNCTSVPASYRKGEEDSVRYDTWCASAANWQEQTSIVHTYYDDWYMTGLNVREDQGGKVAAIFQPKPNLTNGKKYENYLWKVANGLEKSFVAGRAGTSAMSVSEIQRRFNQANTAPATQSWNIPKDGLKVTVYDFKDQTGLTDLPTTKTKELLKANFNSSDTPTILFAREENFRVATLDMDSGIVGVGQSTTTSGVIKASALTLNLDPKTLKVQTLAGLNWAPYRYEGTEWKAYPLEEYSQYLDGNFSALFPQDNTQGKADNLALQSYYASFYAGAYHTTKVGDQTLSISTAEEDSSLSAISDVVGGSTGLFSGLAGSIDNYLDADALGQNKAIALGSLAGAVAVTRVVLASWALKDPDSKGVRITSIALDVVDVVMAAHELYNVVKDIREASKVIQAVKTTQTITRGAKIVAVLGLVLEVGMAVGMFAFQWASGAIQPGTPAFKQALTTMIVQIVVAVVFLAISLIPVLGQIIMAYIGLIEGMITLVCKIVGKEGGVCDGLVGNLVKVLVGLFYDYTPLMDLTRADRLDIKGFNQKLNNDEKGYVQGNGLAFNIGVLSKLYKNRSNAIISNLYFSQFNDDNLKKNTLVYEFTNGKETGDQRVHVRRNLKPGTMTSDWIPAGSQGYWLWSDGYRFKLDKQVTQLVQFPTPGINGFTWNLNLAEGQATLAQECEWEFPCTRFWGIKLCSPIPVPICELETEKDSLYFDMGSKVTFDIFPATLDAFAALSPRSGGYALAWDSKFPTLADGDGDGLRSAAKGGNDPNDSKADTDADGLSDFYEIQNAASGFNPSSSDTDGDGLSDYQELIYGTKPNNADSDYDGLKDKQEVDGWDFVYGYNATGTALKAHVRSDPFNADRDGDTLTDVLEYTYGTNPNIWNDPNILKLTTTIDKKFYKPGETVKLTTTLENTLRSRPINGLFQTTSLTGTDLATVFTNYSAIPSPFALNATEKRIVNTNLQLRSDINRSQKFNINQILDSDIPYPSNWYMPSVINPAVDRNGNLFPELYFDDPMGTTSLGQIAACDPCPKTGYIGRYNRAALFSETSGIYAQFPRAINPNSKADRTTFGLWVKPGPQPTASNNERFLASVIRNGFNDEPTVAIYYNSATQRIIYKYAAPDITYPDRRNVIAFEHPTPLKVGEWNYIFIALGQSYKPDSWTPLVSTPPTIEVNGQAMTFDTTNMTKWTNNPPVNDSVGAFLVGGQIWQTRSGNKSLVNTGFVGFIDHAALRWESTFLNGREWMNVAPEVSLHLEDKPGSTSLVNEANSSKPGNVSPSSPTMSTKGKVGRGIQIKSPIKVVPTSTFGANDKVTVSLWVRPDVKVSGQRLVTYPLDLSLGKDGSLNCSISYTDDKGQKTTKTLTLPAGLLPNTWSFVVATYDPTSGSGSEAMNLYVNGNRVRQMGYLWKKVPSSTQNTVIEIGDTSESYNITFDEFNLYRREMSAYEVEKIYNSQVGWYEAMTSNEIVVDNDNPTVKLDFSAPYISNRDIVMAIQANDITSGLSRVEYRVGPNQGSWKTATLDDGVYLFTFQPALSGAVFGTYTIETRATDIVGRNSVGTSVNVTVDKTAPAIGNIVNISDPVQNANGTWDLSLGGTFNDTGNTDSDSGIKALSVYVVDRNGDLVGQTQTLTYSLTTKETSANWTMKYPLGFKPNGIYTIRIQATDNVGNQFSTERTTTVDTLPPYADVVNESAWYDSAGRPVPNVLVGSGPKLPRLRGFVSDIPTPRDPVLQMHLEQTNVYTFFRDVSVNQIVGTCSGTTCPRMGITGKQGAGLTFDGVDDGVVLSEGANYRRTPELLQNNPNAYRTLPDLPEQAMTAAVWVKPTLVSTQLNGFLSAMRAVGGEEKGWYLGSRNGRLGFGLSSSGANDGDGKMTWIENPEAFQANQWYHLAGTYDGTTMQLFVNGQLKATSQVQSGNILYPANAWVGIGAYHDGDENTFFTGMLDEVLIYNRAISSGDLAMMVNDTVASNVRTVEIALRHAKETTPPSSSDWKNASLNTNKSSSWEYIIPEGLEGPYHVWLRTTDAKGNTQVLPKAWIGIIDTKIPTVTLQVNDTTGGKKRYTVQAQDYNITAQNFLSPCGAGITSTQEYYQEPWYQTTFSTKDANGKTVPASAKPYRLGVTCEITPQPVTQQTQPTGKPLTQEVGWLPFSRGNLKGMVIVGNLLYAVDAYNGLLIIDITDPTKPTLVGSAKTTNPYNGYGNDLAWGIDVVGNYAYVVTTQFDSLQIFDVSNPKQPTKISRLPLYAWSVKVVGNYAYVSSQYSLSIVNVTDRANPVVSASYKATDDGRYYTQSFGYLALKGNYLFVGNNLGGQKNTLEVFDISNPSVIKSVKSIKTYSSINYDPLVEGNRLYTKDYKISSSRLLIWDITDPSKTTFLNSYEPKKTIVGFVATSTEAFIIVESNDKYDIQVLDVSDTSNIKLKYTINDTANPNQWWSYLALKSNFLYSASGSMIRVLTSPSGIPIKACDLFGNCTTQATQVAATAAMPASLQDEPVLQETPISPLRAEAYVLEKVAQIGQPVSFDVAAYSEKKLKRFGVTLGGTNYLTQTWSLADNITNTTGIISGWTPLREGVYPILLEAEDWDGNKLHDTSNVFVVDTQAPEVAITKPILSRDDRTIDGEFVLQGVVTDSVSIENVQVTVGEGEQEVDLFTELVDPTTGNVLELPYTARSQDVYNPGTFGGSLRWRAYWPFSNGMPNGFTASAKVIVTDIGHQRNMVRQTITVDGIAPTLGEIALSYKTLTGTTVITPGMTFAAVLDPELTINWQPASDPGGIKRYLVGWTTSPTPTLTALTSYSSTVTSHSQKVSDGQKWYAHVIAEDLAGNQTATTQGPIYVDYGPTPTYISMHENGLAPYRSWSASTCSLVGIDNRINERSSSMAMLNESQKFYTTWNNEGLRLMWTGANWETDGDLFIYLDTKTGGSSQVYNPYPATVTNTVILLPQQNDSASLAALQQQATLQGTSPRPSGRVRLSAVSKTMAADALIWVKNSSTAILMLWDGKAWQPANGGLEYLFEQNLSTPTTDLYVPFTALGITDPAKNSLTLLALTTENEALRLWATMPPRNNVNSQKVIDLEGESRIQQFALIKNYSWPTLGAGVCPGVVANQDQTASLQAGTKTGLAAGADLRASILSQPASIVYSLLNDNLFFAMKDLPQFSGIDWGNTKTTLCAKNPNDPACQSDRASKPALLQGSPKSERLAAQSGTPDFNSQQQLKSVMNVTNKPLGDGSRLTYTLQLANQGTETAKAVVADLYTWGAVRLDGSEQRSDSFGEYNYRKYLVGDLAPGQTVSATLGAVIDANFDKTNQNGWATIDTTVYDATGAHQHLPDGTDVYTNELEWLYADIEVDTAPPSYLEIQEPQGLIGLGETTARGFVYDRSSVPTLELEIQQPNGTVLPKVCKDDQPADGQWACAFDPGAVQTGETVKLRGRATDKFGNVSQWSPWTSLLVDTTSPRINLDAKSQSALQDGALGPEEATLTGGLWDERQVKAVKVCETTTTGEVCTKADVSPDPATQPKATYTYEDAPATGLALGSSTPCTKPLVRTFEVTETFTIADLNVGLNLSHKLRSDINATLTSPAGTQTVLLYDGQKAQNYDVLLDDASPTLDHDDSVEHDISAPFYKNQRGGYGLLRAFNGEKANGTWKLSICDYFPTDSDGTYQRSSLFFTSATLPYSTTGRWQYTIPIAEPATTTITTAQLLATPKGNPAQPNALLNVTSPFAVYLPLVARDLPVVQPVQGDRTLRIYGLDSAGNQSTQPLTYLYRQDNTPPKITVTNPTTNALTLKQADILSGTAQLQLSGTVADPSGIMSMTLVLIQPTNQMARNQLSFTQTTWNYASAANLTQPGAYTIWVEAIDQAGNLRQEGPLTLTVQAAVTSTLTSTLMLQGKRGLSNLNAK